MTPFLKQVVTHYFPAGEVGKYCFIFPGKRAVLFFHKYLREAVAGAGRPAAAPLELTMSDFFYRLTGAGKTDRIQLLVDLYACYQALNPQAERLDDFLYWGTVLLGDFNDIDKYLIEADKLLTNISDLKNIQDRYSYLTEQQEEAIRRFAGHFHKGSPAEKGKADYKQRFRQIWDILLPLYRDFRSRLRDRGRSYEGMVYRDLAERLDDTPAVDLLRACFPDTEKFVFVGLNALNECERKVLRRMRDAGVAEFCWDFSSEEIRDPRGKASLFLNANVQDFPQAFRPDPDGLGRPEVHVLNVPSSVGQAARLPQILQETGTQGMETAIVLPDEQLLLPVLNSLPPHLAEINVTMGYPMTGSEFAGFFEDLAALQAHVREREDGFWFYHRQVWSLFSNSLFKRLRNEEEAGRADGIRKQGRFYISAEELAAGPLTALMFRPMRDDVASYLKELLEFMGRSLREQEDSAIEREFTLSCYKTVVRLEDLKLDLQPATWMRLFCQLIASDTVPFKGEPLKGLQIMGPLETRALDFDTLVILSCNEGIFPRRSVEASFIPPELRKGFGLPTYEFQDAVWAYYFYRAIQRARQVWLVTDTRTEISRSGEESRYIKQLELHYGWPLHRHIVKADLQGRDAEQDIPKTEEDVALIRSKELSASSLQKYLDCPAQFYYTFVKGIYPEEEVEESLDAAALGNTFHHTMQQLYQGAPTLSREKLDALLGDEAGIRARVEANIMEELHCFEVSGRNLVYRDIVCSYVRKTLERDRQLLRTEGKEAFRILGLERKLHCTLDGFRLKGTVDRFDSLNDEVLRVVDYKTGRVLDDEMRITDDNAEQVVKKLFGPKKSERPKIALQLYLYDLLVRDLPEARGRAVANAIYHTGRLFTEPVHTAPRSERFCTLMQERLASLLAELSDVSVPFRRTDDADACKYCDFKTLCGR